MNKLFKYKLNDYEDDNSGSKYIEEHYNEILNYVTNRLKVPERAKILISDVYCNIRTKEVNHTWHPNYGYVENTVYSIINIYLKSNKYYNDFCDNEGRKDNRDYFGSNDNDYEAPDLLQQIHDTETARLIYNKYINKDTFNAKLIVYTLENVEKCLNIERCFYNCLTMEEKEDLKDLLYYINDYSIEQLKGIKEEDINNESRKENK